LTLLGTGNVGIGTTAPSTLLSIGTGSIGWYAENTGGIGGLTANRPAFHKHRRRTLIAASSQPALNMAEVWNDNAHAFTLVKGNVTNTASAAGSYLIDVGTGGGSYVSPVQRGNDRHRHTSRVYGLSRLANPATEGGVRVNCTGTSPLASAPCSSTTGAA